MTEDGVEKYPTDFPDVLAAHVGELAWLLAAHHENELCMKLGANGPNSAGALQGALRDLSHFRDEVAKLRLDAYHDFHDNDFEDLGIVPSDFGEDLGVVPTELTGPADQNGYASINQIHLKHITPEDAHNAKDVDFPERRMSERSSLSLDSQPDVWELGSADQRQEGIISTKVTKLGTDTEGWDLPSRTLSRRTRTKTTSFEDQVSFTILPIWVDSSEPNLLRSESFLADRRVSTNSAISFTMTESEQILSSMTPSPVTILPGSRFRSTWDILTLFLIMYDCIATPLELLDEPKTTFQEVMGWSIRIFWTIDLFMNFLTGFIRKDGLTEVRFLAIGKRYAKTWLVADVCLVISDWSEIIMQAFNSEASIARMAKASRVMRTFRTLRFVKMQKAMNFLKLRVESEAIVMLLDILRGLIIMFGFVHVGACVWCGFGVWTSEWGEQTWLYAANLENISAGERYMESFMWALGQFSGGVDFVRPQNKDERIFSVAAVIVGFILESAFISRVTSEVTKLMLITGGPSKLLAQLMRYLTQHNVSRVLTVRTQRNAKYHMEVLDKQINFEQVEALKYVSEPLQQELFLEIHGPHLTHHPLFFSYSKLCPAGMRQLCTQSVTAKMISVGDALFHRLEAPVIPKMFFLLQGTMRYVQRKDETTEVEPGEWASEAVLWTMWTHCGTLSGISPCQVMVVDAKTFQSIVKTSESAVNVEEYALSFVDELNRLPSNDLSDIGNVKTALSWSERRQSMSMDD